MSRDADTARLGSRSVARVVWDEATVRARVRELGAEITAAYTPDDRLLVISFLKGSFLFHADLVREIRVPLHVDFLVAASYGTGTESSGEVRLLYDPPSSFEGRSVLVVEDVIDSGTTLRRLLPRLEARGPATLDVCTLLHKRLPDAGVEARWVGFDAPKAFLVGYGLDHAEDFRHLPYIASL